MNGEYKRILNSGIKILALSALLVFVMSGCREKSEKSNEALEIVSTQIDEKGSVPEPSGTPRQVTMETLSPQPSAAVTPEVEASEASDLEEVTTPEPSLQNKYLQEYKSQRKAEV